jgi:hypothetical protein
MPCAFRPQSQTAGLWRTNSVFQPAELPLFNALTELKLHPDMSTKAARAISGLLDSQSSALAPAAIKISPAYYAREAAAACLANQEPSLAEQLILRGLKFEPNADALLYLARIHSRLFSTNR